MCTADKPTLNDILTATFIDDTVILITREDHATASANLQALANEFNTWDKRWKIKTNNIKSVRINFAFRPHLLYYTTLNDDEIPISTHVKYLGIHQEAHLENAYREETHGGQTQIPLSIRATPLNREQKTAIPFCYQTNLDLCSSHLGKRCQR